MIKQLEEIKARYEEITKLLSSEVVMKDKEKLISLLKERSELKDIVSAYTEFQEFEKRIIEAEHIIEVDKDEELKDMARIELNELKE
ncbi:MAG: PCRF domain-containing protein, partial [Candidatus Cloacimonadota bacterium]